MARKFLADQRVYPVHPRQKHSRCAAEIQAEDTLRESIPDDGGRFSQFSHINLARDRECSFLADAVSVFSHGDNDALEEVLVVCMNPRMNGRAVRPSPRREWHPLLVGQAETFSGGGGPVAR